MGPMGELGALFNPGMRHEIEERQAKAARREEEGNARDGDLRIDLESGVAVINIPGEDDATDHQTGSDGQDLPADQAAPTDEQASPAADATSATDGDADESATPAAPSAATADQSATPAPDPAALRPRGKRGMSTSSR